jgi:hypothetical protein
MRTLADLPPDFFPDSTRESLDAVRKILKRPTAAARERIRLCNAPAFAPAQDLPAFPFLSEETEMRLQRALQCRVRNAETAVFSSSTRARIPRAQRGLHLRGFFASSPLQHVLAVQIQCLRHSSPHAFDLWDIF